MGEDTICGEVAFMVNLLPAANLPSCNKVAYFANVLPCCSPLQFQRRCCGDQAPLWFRCRHCRELLTTALAVWASCGAVQAPRKGPNTFSLASRSPRCCQPSISCAVCWPISGCGSPSLCPEGHSRRLVIGLVGLGVGLLIGADLLLLIVACKILRYPASSGPFGLFYSIGGCSTVTLGPNGLFYQGSRGGMYKRRCERLSRPLGGTAVGLTPGGGLVGRPPDGPPQKTKWAALPCGPVSYGVGQTTPREALPTLGGRGRGGWLCSGGRRGWSSP